MATASGSELRSGGAIGRRVLAVVALTIIVALLAAGAALTLLFERNVLQRVAQELEHRWIELARQFAINDKGEPALAADLSDPRYLVPFGGSYWQVTRDGAPVLRSRSLWDVSLVPGTDQLAEIAGPEGTTLYAFSDAVSVDVAGKPAEFVLSVALDHAEVEELRQSFMRDSGLVLLAFGAVLIGGAALTWRYGLMPLKRLETALTAVRGGEAARLTGLMPQEVLPLAADLNAMLDRQEEQVKRARDRAGALAHGLKTPLTILRNELEALEAEGGHARAAAMRGQIDEIAAHVERELAKARMHAAAGATGTRILIRPILDRLIGLMRRMDVDGRITWQLNVPEDQPTDIEADDFAEIAGNLLDNARKFASASVVVSVEAEAGAKPVLVIADDGPGVPPDRLLAMRERGFSIGPDGSESSGLGLSIASDALAAHGRMLELSSALQAAGCAARFPLLK